MTRSLPIPEILTVYGASWCGDCWNTQRFLDAAGIDYRYVDVGADRASQAMLDDAGYRAIPIVVMTDGMILIEPSAHELATALGFGAARPAPGRST